MAFSEVRDLGGSIKRKVEAWNTITINYVQPATI